MLKDQSQGIAMMMTVRDQSLYQLMGSVKGPELVPGLRLYYQALVEVVVLRRDRQLLVEELVPRLGDWDIP